MDYPQRKKYSNLTDEQISKLKKLIDNRDKKSSKDKKNYKQEPFKPLLNKNKFDNLRNSHVDHTIEAFTSYIKDKMSESNANYVTEAGDVENWKGGMSQEELEKELQEGLEFLKSMRVE